MPCLIESPCGGSLRLVDQVGQRTVLSCLNGHHHVVEVKTPEARRRDLRSDKGREAQVRYRQSEKFRAMVRRYNSQPHRRAANVVHALRYQKTAKGQASVARYQQSEKHRAMVARYLARRKAKAS